jgi:hypothetical protein
MKFFDIFEFETLYEHKPDYRFLKNACTAKQIKFNNLNSRNFVFKSKKMPCGRFLWQPRRAKMIQKKQTKKHCKM